MLRRTAATLMIVAMLACWFRAGAGEGETKAECAKSKAAAQKNDTLVIEARLIEIPGDFPANDLYNYVYVMKYRIIKVRSGSYEGKEILIGHYNPLIPRKQVKDKMDPYVDGTVVKFAEGDKHVLTLITPIETVWNDAQEDEYIDSEDPRFYALKADVLKKK